MSAGYTFLPWMREGLAAGIRAEDAPGASLPARATSALAVEVNDERVDTRMWMHGPGDVIALNPGQIVRTDPPPLTNDFEPNFFPLVEFDRPDLPWMFTPAKAAATGRLRPWLVLVVVAHQPGVTLAPEPRAPLHVLRIAPPAAWRKELVDLAASWAWAHAQVAGSDGTPTEEAAAAASADNLSRLICPRRLLPGTRYLACLVPAFEQGRRAGLGLPVDEEVPLAPAWPPASGDEVVLPVYHHWDFSTGSRGDFESLVRRLRPRPLAPWAGSRAMAVRDLGQGLPDLGTVRLGGVLRSPNTRLGIVPDDFKAAMRELLNRQLDQDAADPIVGPPIYGRYQARLKALPPYGGEPRWTRSLNLDPRYRIAAGLGAAVVQDRQEELMASAWEQLGEIEEVVQLRVRAQLSVEVGRSVHVRHFMPLSTDRIYQVAAPAASRVRLSPATLTASLATRRIAPAATTGAMRRITRRGGPVMRRAGLGPAAGAETQQLFLRMAGGGPAIPWFLYFNGMTTGFEVARQKSRLDAAAAPLAQSTARARRLQASLGRMAGYVMEAQTRSLIAVPTVRSFAATAGALDDMRTTLLARLDPAQTIPPRASQRQVLPDGGQVPAADATDPLAPMPHPVFPAPMYAPLAEMSPELLMPGLESVGPETVTLAETDPRFVEAYMVGLNHEMARELLWRRYPTDQRGTYFRRFWDTRGAIAATPDQLDPIGEWPGNRRLGDSITAARGPGRLVLLIRGELLRRYPGALIYAARPQSPPALDPAETHHPIFRGRLEPDITFLGFDLSLPELTVDTGLAPWYFVIQQPATDLRFGLDLAEGVGADAPALASWDDLTWGHIAETADELQGLGHVDLSGRLAGTTIDGTSWGRNSAHMAAITMQRPARIAIRASMILAKPDTESAS